MIAAAAGGAERQRIAWRDVEGWAGADLAPAFAAFTASARVIARGDAAVRPACQIPQALAVLARHITADGRDPPSEHPRAMFERCFEPFSIVPPARQGGFLTGYYEPVLDGALTPEARFTAPVLDWPGATAAPTRDRAGWEAFSLTADARPVLWLRDWTELFLVQVQGSARVRLPDGSQCRLVYAGRNGHPYTSIGRRLVETGRMPADAMSLAALKAWLRAHGQAPGDEARSLMQENRSYIFFRREPDRGDGVGPVGGQGLPLQAGVSIAVDRTLWCYGLPFWISAPPLPGFGPAPLRRLFIAQDTGSAIVGPARIDLFLGSGEAAGDAAGSIRHPAAVTVLLPRPAP